MAIFGREESEDYPDVEKRRLGKSIPTRAFKDLNPENKKKRREPTKPWGKRERLFVFFILLATVILSGFLALWGRDYKLPGFPKLSFGLPLFSFKGETIIIEGNKDNKEKSQKAISLFTQKTKTLSGVYGVYVIRLSDDSSYGVNEKEIFQGASLLKLPLMAALYKEVDKGNIDLDAKYTLKNSDKVPGSGSLWDMPAGTILSYRDLARLMGKESDRTAFKIVKNTLGDAKLNDILLQAGMVNTSTTTGETTPYDIGIFLKKLWKRELVSEKSRNEIFSYLTDTTYEDWLPAGIPNDIKVAHKYGRDTNIVNDAGIVFAQKPFILVIMSNGVIEKEADKVIPQLAKSIYEIEVGTR